MVHPELPKAHMLPDNAEEDRTTGRTGSTARTGINDRPHPGPRPGGARRRPGSLRGRPA
jgi:hypothetical protein